MAQVKKGDRVSINFVGTLEDGTVFDTTFETDMSACDVDGCDTDDCGCCGEVGPMELTIGEGEFFSQIEEALIGMAPGEKKTVTISADEAFGDYDEDKIFTVSRKDIPDDIYPEVGQELELIGDDDEILEVTVIEVDDEDVTLDANHPLAGKSLAYEVELVEIF